jgi:hypothetical protein
MGRYVRALAAYLGRHIQQNMTWKSHPNENRHNGRFFRVDGHSSVPRYESGD